MTSIVQEGDPVLRRTAEPVAAAEFGSVELLRLVSDMKDTLAREEDGAALAAPQIGVSKQIFVIAERVFGSTNEEHGSSDPHLVFINPRLTKLSKKKEEMDEGCLSVRGTYGVIKRANRATIEAQDEYGKTFTRGAGGLLAQVFQHECDHLAGTLFTDRAERTWQAEYPQRS
ncbi:peptide deformylase [Patescibacteria group bacterium]|jgi:peptide deformylase|nr:peptide deformylase [Patescibacteria group bacterium]